MKILYLCTKPFTLQNGGMVVANRNLNALRKILGTNAIIEYQVHHPTLKTVGRSLLTLSSYGISHIEENHILSLQQKEKCNIVFIEGSLRGNLVRRLYKRNCKTIVFAHNVETSLYRQRMKRKRNLISLIQYKYVHFNEHQSIRYANRIIVLNKRDYQQMQIEFHRKADAILPITCPERNLQPGSPIKGRPYCLFVGSDFFPNVDGILWFIDHVAPYIPMDLRIVGACTQNTLLQNHQLPANVFLDGYVNDLATYYQNAAAVIAPIFSGSGMKTKTVEAMSYGKSIFGTNEAFEGIECDYNRIGGLCNTAEDFIRHLSTPHKLFNTYTLQLFQESYTDTYFENHLKELLWNI